VRSGPGRRNERPRGLVIVESNLYYQLWSILDLPAAVVLTYTREGIAEAIGPDRCRVVLGSWSWASLAATIGRFDADIEIIGPPELKAAFAHLAQRYANAAEEQRPYRAPV